MKAKTNLELKRENDALRNENNLLRYIAQDLQWMARRYADGRRSYAPSMLNDYTRKLLALGLKLNPTGDGTIWARDADGPSASGLTPEEYAQGKK